MQRRHLLLMPCALTATRNSWATEPALGVAGEPIIAVAAASPLSTLSRAQAVAYFTGRQRALPTGEPVQPLDLPAAHPLRERFYRLLTGLGPAQMNSYWARLSFSGQMQPPQVVDTEAAMLRSLRDNPCAIGYLPRLPEGERLRVLLVLSAPAA